MLTKKAGDFMIVKEKGLTGLLGDILHKHLRLDQPNNCRHVKVDSFGQKLKNETYTGALKLFKEEKIDWYVRTEPLYNLDDDSGIFTISHGSFEDGFYIGHLFKPKINNDAADCLKMFDIELDLILFSIFAFFFAFLITFFITCKILAKFNLVKKIELISKQLLELDFSLSQKMNSISIFLLFYAIYFFIFKNILSNNIKSNQVVVDTSDLVMDRDDLENTKRTICYWHNQFEYKIISTSLNGSFLNRIYNKSKNKCTYSSDPQSFLEQKINFEDSVLILNLQNLVGIESWISNLPQVRDKFLFTTKEPLFKVLASHAFKKNIDPYFMDVSLQETELGLQNKVNELIVSTFIATFEYRIRLFRTKNSYVDEFTSTENLGIEYFEDFFRIYIFIGSIVFLIHFFSLVLGKFSAFTLIRR